MRAWRLALLAPAVIALGCWADFPPELLDPDGTHDADARARDGARDAGMDRGRDGRGVDLAPSDARLEGTGDAKSLLGLGATCSLGTQCYSGQCADKVCCNQACTGACMACNLSGSSGQCLPVAAGQDPDSECLDQSATSCGTDGYCDGNGACRKWPAGTVCAQPTCAGTSGEKLTLPKVCDGAGACVTLGEITCSPYRCNQSTGACNASCTTSAQCITGKTCASNKCDGALQPDGTSCTLGTQCASGKCVDNVCCDAACTATCETCKLSLTWASQPVTVAGKCLDIPAGMDPANECAASAAATCDLDGTCDGAGACRKHPSGTICATPSCGSGTLSPFSKCDGNGACKASGASTSCGKYVCLSSTSCYGFCTSNAHCATGSTCSMVTSTCQ